MLAAMPANLRASLSKTETANALGVHVRTLNNWLRDGYGPRPVRDGNRLLYDRADVDAFAAGVR